MRIGAVIAEYNMLHNGHVYQLADFRKNAALDFVIIVMSGNFVQRGEPAICDKRTRALWALQAGADMVLELPVYYAVSNAECFARGAIGTIAGIADVLGFGAETDDLELMNRIAKINTKEIRQSKSGKSFPRELYEWTLENLGSEYADVLKKPNSTLALEYLRAKNALCPEMEVYITKRMGVEHDSDNTYGCYASATKLRELIKAGESIDSFVPSYVNIEKFITLADFEKLILYKFRYSTPEYLESISGMAEGLHNLFKKEAFNSTSLDELLCRVKSKRFTMARLKRICICTMLGITEEMAFAAPEYIHVLGVRESCREELLSALHRKTKLPLLTRGNDYKSFEKNASMLLENDVASTDIYSLFYNTLPKSDYNNKLLIF